VIDASSLVRMSRADLIAFASRRADFKSHFIKRHLP
jgi:hypothetical protein